MEKLRKYRSQIAAFQLSKNLHVLPMLNTTKYIGIWKYTDLVGLMDIHAWFPRCVYVV